MRDSSDSKTGNLPGVPTPPRRRGRPALYRSPAERQRAYRQRQKKAGKNPLTMAELRHLFVTEQQKLADALAEIARLRRRLAELGDSTD
jgi:hypothetical protein